MQAIPSIFRNKISVDSSIKMLTAGSIISFGAASAALKQQSVLRRQCQIALAIHKVDQDGPGSPVAMVA